MVAFVPSCPEGYMLLMDGKTCTDADECKDNTRICNGGKCKVEGFELKLETKVYNINPRAFKIFFIRRR